MRKRNTALTQIVVLAALTLTSCQTALVPALEQTPPGVNQLSIEQQGALHRYAIDAWRSLVAMTSPDTGLPADNISASGKLEHQTSPTNIASSIWSTLAARDLRIIPPNEAHQSISRILNTLSRMKYHQPSGMFYNRYDARTGDKLNTQNPDHRLLSAVDNGWLATALIMIRNNMPELHGKAQSILDRMHFDMFYDDNPDDDGMHENGEKKIVVDLLRGGFWDEPLPADDKRKVIPGNYAKRGSDMVFYENYHNSPLNTETRIASYIGIVKREFTDPAKHYFTLWRTAPITEPQQMQPGGQSHVINGFTVFEGYYPYRGMKIVPSWGGSIFEALMVTLFVPEAEWGPKSWGVNHPCYVRAQIEHGLLEAQYGYWGFSPSSNPSPASEKREYGEYGVDAIGIHRDGYYSNNGKTSAESSPPASDYTNGVVTPHAIFLALPFAPDAALQNLANLRRDFKDAYGRYGFYDAINVQTGQVAQYYLALDQGMIMAAIANHLGNNQLQGYFANDDVKDALEPLLRDEVFGSGCEAKPHPTGRERR